MITVWYWLVIMTEKGIYLWSFEFKLVVMKLMLRVEQCFLDGFD